MKQIKITDLHGKEIVIEHPKSTLAQLEIFLQLIETEPHLMKDEEPAVYWINLYEKLKAAIKG